MAEDPVTALLAALAELFGVMLIGFVVFRLQLLELRDMKGIGFVLGRLVLPVLIFSVVSVVNYEQIDWGVVACAIIVRLLLMAVCFIVGAAASTGGERWVVAASAASCMQSNDVAFGIPLVLALYPPAKYGTKYLDLLTGILAAWTVCSAFVLVMWEVSAAKRDDWENAGHSDATELRDNQSSPPGLPTIGERLDQNLTDEELSLETSPGQVGVMAAQAETLVQGLITVEEGAAESKATPEAKRPSLIRRPSLLLSIQVAAAGVVQPGQQSLFVKVVLNSVRNPILISTTLGICYRIAGASTLTYDKSGYHLPTGLDGIVNTIKAAYTFLVLFALGESMQNNMGALMTPGGMRLPAFLCFMKLVASPALLLSLLGFFTSSQGGEFSELRNFVVMFGLLPSSEAGLVWEKMYKARSSANTSCTVFMTTVLCGPLIFLGNVYLQDMNPDNYETTFKDTFIALSIMSLITSALFLISFVIMGRQWLSSTILRHHLVLALVLAVYYVTSLVIYVGTNDNGFELCSSTDAGSKFFYIVRESSRLSVDLLITTMAICMVFLRRKSEDLRKKVSQSLMVSAICLSVSIYVVLEVLEDPTTTHEAVSNCLAKLPSEIWLSPTLRCICLVVTSASLLHSLRQSRTEADAAMLEQMGQPETAGFGQTTYALGVLQAGSWIVQIMTTAGNTTTEQNSAIVFMLFIGATCYMLLSLVQCLMFTLRGECLQRWRQLFAKMKQILPDQ